MITAQDIFVTAMTLMDEETEDGTFAGYPEEYKKKAWPILTLLQAELIPPQVTPTVILDNTSVFNLDDKIGLTILPYGLAAHLLLNEDQNRAAFFNNRYDELKIQRPATVSKMKDVWEEEPKTSTEDPTTDDQFVFDTPGTIDGGEF
jgi:hypothetical protein